MFGCKKAERTSANEVIELPVSGKVRSILQYDSVYVICGGDKTENGFILTTTDFVDFNILLQNFERSVYSSGFHNRLFYFGCSNVEILLSDSLTETHPYYYQQQYWINNQHKQPIKTFCNVGNEFIGIAGGELRFGVLMQFDESQAQFISTEHDNELRSVAFNATSKQALALGNGIALTKSDTSKTWHRLISPPEYYTSVIAFEDHFLATTLDGSVRELKIVGNQIIPMGASYKLTSTEYLNFITQNEHYQVVVGTNGLVATKALGGDWKLLKLNTDMSLQSAIIVGDKVIIGDEGRLLSIDL